MSEIKINILDTILLSIAAVIWSVIFWSPVVLLIPVFLWCVFLGLTVAESRKFEEHKIGIKNLYYYYPTIYTDRNYDFGYIFLLLSKKLENIEEFPDSNKKTNQSLRICKKLCSRIAKEEYENDEIMKRDIRWLFRIMEKYVCWWWW